MQTAKQPQKPIIIQEELRAKVDVVLSDLRSLEPTLYQISKRKEGWEEDLDAAKLQLRTIALSCKTYLNWMRDIELAEKRKAKKQK